MAALDDDQVDRKITEKALSVTIPALGDNRLRSIQECSTAMAAGINCSKNMLKTL